ncbi:hypothetical protein A0H81_10040 [Grifola frondosa]|uniref:Uncharacterized protein n=1 Tax=Grifola frondosa TaxID=5627 RepID=A0A1C7M261_GRIFR|nr:hypothetical protein A0H81_10040 [Grifola frondosa]
MWIRPSLATCKSNRRAEPRVRRIQPVLSLIMKSSGGFRLSRLRAQMCSDGRGHATMRLAQFLTEAWGTAFIF